MIVITGIGLATALGNDVSSFWKASLEGKISLEEVPAFWKAQHKTRATHWSPLEIPPLPSLYPTEKLQMDRHGLLAIHSILQCLEDAKIQTVQVNERKNTFILEGYAPEDVGIFLGTTGCGFYSLLSTYHAYILTNKKEDLMLPEKFGTPKNFSPYLVSKIMADSVVCKLAGKFNIEGPVENVCFSCAAGTMAVGRAYQALKEGRCRIAIAGACDYLCDPYGSLFIAFDRGGLLAHPGKRSPEEVNCPFDKERSGFLFSEGGGAFLMLEDESNAKQRGVTSYAGLVGYAEGFSSEGYMAMESGGKSLINLWEKLCKTAGVVSNDIDYVNAHGTGTINNDEVEARAMAQFFRNDVLINSSKSLLGHTICASGAIEAAITALSIREQTTHPVKNLKDPILPLNFAREVKQERIRLACSHSFSLGGHRAALLFAQPGGI